MRRTTILLLFVVLGLAVGYVNAQPISPLGGGGVSSGTVAAIPACTASTKGAMYVVTDGASGADCSTGGGSDVNDCICDGSAYVDADNASGGGAPTTADYLTGTAQGGLSAEIIVGATPGGELGGSWASPTIDATHSGSSHASVQSAAEATAASALSTHESDITDVHGVNIVTPADAHLLLYDGITDNRFENVPMSGDVTMTAGGVTTVANESHTHVALNISNLSANSDITADLEEETHAAEHLENAADEILVEALGTACTDGQVVKADATGGLDCAEDEAAGATTEAALETQLTDVTDVFTNNDGALADDDLSNNSLSDLSDILVTTPADAHFLIYDNVDSRFENKVISGDVTITAAGVATVANGSHSHTAGDVTDINGGTDVTADLEEETHAGEHSENAADEIFAENLGTSCTDGQVIKANATGGLDCAADSVGGGGTANILDLGDDSGNDSVDLIEIATTGDVNNIFTEPSADKLLINLGNDWPKADLADALAANGANCSTGSANVGVTAAGVSEGCFDVATQVEFDTHTSNTTTAHGLNTASPIDGHLFLYDGVTDNRFENVAMSGDVTITAAGVTTVANDSHTHVAANISNANGGTDITADLEEETHVTEHAENGADELLGEALGTACTDGQILKANASGGLDCATDATGAGGSAITLDLGDDAGNDSVDLNEIATTGDTNNIFTESAADKLLINLANDWPKADLADALAANGANCSANEFAAGVSAAGVAEGCADVITEAELTTEAHLETQLTDVTNVLTNNDIIWTSLGIGPGMFAEDAASACGAPAIHVVGSKRVVGIICADGGTLSFTVDSPTNWVPGAVDFQITYARGATGAAFAADVQLQCRGDDDPINNTYTNATTGVLDFTLSAVSAIGDRRRVEASTLSLDNGAGGTTCAAGDTISGRITIDDANHDATNTVIIAARLQLRINAGGEQ